MPPERQGQWQPRLSGASRRSTQPSTNAISSHRWPLRQQALLGPRLSLTCGNACLSLSNGKCRCSDGNNGGHHPQHWFLFLTVFLSLGGTECFPFNYLTIFCVLYVVRLIFLESVASKSIMIQKLTYMSSRENRNNFCCSYNASRYITNKRTYIISMSNMQALKTIYFNKTTHRCIYSLQIHHRHHCRHGASTYMYLCTHTNHNVCYVMCHKWLHTLSMS